ncbi:hypothetical protein M378DRAFT_184959 [Amanita muscaria Koide BX008]|uniref:DNA repair protein REV1 n=1 Tax=Amanita muscaria (strain Koide BX008) TaxID=946122 RepID=A0A0C2XGI4_AMAMK|nr:hypothetical protein M378DRAFT_184959 [Amanita muscaria Koide BX008]
MRPSLLPLGGDEAGDIDIYGASHFGQFGEYMRRKRAKLQIQNATLTQPGEDTVLFRGLSIHINGWTQPSVQELRQLIVQNGGIYLPYLDKKSLVTHVVTCTLTPAKAREFKNMKIVLPTWIINSVKEKKLLPWQDYRYVHQPPVESAQGTRIEQRTLLSFATNSKILATETKLRVNTNTTIPLTEDSQPAELQSKHAETKASIPYAADISNRNAQKALANPEWRRTHTSAAPDFVEGYYRNSRLHYLSTWKAELRALIAEAQEQLEQDSHTTISETDVHAEMHMPRTDVLPTANMHEIEPKKAGSTESVIDKIMLPHSANVIRDQTNNDMQRVIMHCDFDCFFVSVGLITHPHLRGKPVVVCHSQGTQGGASSTSEIASASYEARKQGVKNGMSLQQARRLCPTIMTMPYEFERYKQLSLQFYNILLQHADDIQAVSVDEALVDVTREVRKLSRSHRCHVSSQPCNHDTATELAERIRTQVRQATGCEISIGIAHNILLARLATRRAKPAGSFHISSSNQTSAEILQFMSPHDITDLPGFGSAAKSKALDKLGSSNVGKLIEISKARLCEVFGPGNGATLWGFIRGIDKRPLERDGGRRSVSCDINYGIRFADQDEAERFTYQMAKEVKRRLDDLGMHGSLITLKVLKRSASAPIEPPKFLGCGKCDSFTKQAPLYFPGGRAASDDQVIGQHAWRLLNSFHFDPQELRGIGIQIQRLQPNIGSKGTNSTAGAQTLLSFGKEISSPSSRHANSNKTVDQHGKQRKSTSIPPQMGVLRDERKQDVARDLEISTLSQAEFNMYHALPRDVKRELDEEFRYLAQSPVAGPSKVTSTKGAIEEVPTRSSLSLQKRNLDQMLKSKTQRISESELRSLSIDPVVFFSLPEEVQQEQLVRTKLSREREDRHYTVIRKKVLKPRKSSAPLAEPRLRLSRPKAEFGAPQPPQLAGRKLHLEDTQEIQNAISDWVDRYRHWTPKEKDVGFFMKHLLRCVGDNSMSDGGIEKATAVLKWWLVLLRRYWGPQEEKQEQGAVNEVAEVGEAWWRAFRGVKVQLDAKVRVNFGGSISLR